MEKEKHAMVSHHQKLHLTSNISVLMKCEYINVDNCAEHYGVRSRRGFYEKVCRLPG